MATVDADGTPTVVAPTGPFGERTPEHNAPANFANGTSNAYLGAHSRPNEIDYSILPTQMGARVYIPELGRFLQVDPVEGGTLNNYVYAMDPVNQHDISGKAIPFVVLGMIARAALTSAVRVFVPALIGLGPVRGPVRLPSRVVPTRPALVTPSHVQKAVTNLKMNNYRAPSNIKSKPYENNPDKYNGGVKLPSVNQYGQSIKYREFDVNASVPGVNRGKERLVVGNDKSIYYTNDHYDTFTMVQGGSIYDKPLW